MIKTQSTHPKALKNGWKKCTALNWPAMSPDPIQLKIFGESWSLPGVIWSIVICKHSRTWTNGKGRVGETTSWQMQEAHRWLQEMFGGSHRCQRVCNQILGKGAFITVHIIYSISSLKLLHASWFFLLLLNYFGHLTKIFWWYKIGTFPVISEDIVQVIQTIQGWPEL